MDFETFRPFFTGAIGGLLSLLLIRRWAPHVPQAYKAKAADQLAAENRIGIIVGNVLFIATMLVGVYLFKETLIYLRCQTQGPSSSEHRHEAADPFGI